MHHTQIRLAGAKYENRILYDTFVVVITHCFLFLILHSLGLSLSSLLKILKKSTY